MKKQRRPSVIILSLTCATLLAALLWWKEPHSRGEDHHTPQRQAFKAAAAGKVEKMRALSAAAEAEVTARANGPSETEPGRKPATLQVVLHEVTRLALFKFSVFTPPDRYYLVSSPAAA